MWVWWACVGVWGVDDFIPNVCTYVCCCMDWNALLSLHSYFNGVILPLVLDCLTVHTRTHTHAHTQTALELPSMWPPRGLPSLIQSSSSTRNAFFCTRTSSPLQRTGQMYVRPLCVVVGRGVRRGEGRGGEERNRGGEWREGVGGEEQGRGVEGGGGRKCVWCT